MSGSINNIGSLTTSLMPPLVTQTPPLLNAIASTGTVTIGGEKWDISAPSDVTIKTPDVNGGVLEFDINYNDQSLLGQTHGIDLINITPEVNDVGNASGFKEPVKFVVTNDMSVPISGFDLFTFNQTPVGVPDANDPTGHPNNYAHFHGIAANPFGPETVTTYLPDFTPAGTSPASEIRATGTLLPGQSVSASAATFHSEEIAGDNNGFGVAFFPIASQATTPPVITGLAPTETTDGVPPFLPFINTSVTDPNALPIEVATITVKDANGNLTDVDALAGTGLTHSGVGTYTMTSLPTELTAQLQALNFKEVSASDTLTLSVDNSGQTGFPKPATASTVVTLTPSTSVDGTTVVTDGPTLTDAINEKWSIVKGQVAVNGVVDQATHRVVAIGYADGKIWQENADKNWWSKTTSSDTWTQGSPPASIAGVVLHVSADNTVLPVTDQNQTIIDVNQNTWSFIGGQVSINGQLDPQTGHGQALRTKVARFGKTRIICGGRRVLRPRHGTRQTGQRLVQWSAAVCPRNRPALHLTRLL